MFTNDELTLTAFDPDAGILIVVWARALLGSRVNKARNRSPAMAITDSTSLVPASLCAYIVSRRLSSTLTWYFGQGCEVLLQALVLQAPRIDLPYVASLTCHGTRLISAAYERSD